MTIIDRVQDKINRLPLGKVHCFSEVKLRSVSKDTIRQSIHRLADRGEVELTGRGMFKKADKGTVLVFVYGSLKEGFDNHDVINPVGQKIGKAWTVAKFAMYEDGFGNYPYLIRDGINKIEGELYKVDAGKGLERLDEFEGAPDLYVRESIRVKTRKQTYNAYTYIRQGADVPAGQKPLSVWTNDVAAKALKYRKFLGLGKADC